MKRRRNLILLKNYVEDDGADELEDMIKTKKSLWGIASESGRGRERGVR